MDQKRLRMKTMYLEIRERNCSSDLWVRVTKVELLVEEIELGDRARSRSRLMTSSSPFPRRDHVKATDKRRFDPSILRDSVAHHISLLRCYVATELQATYLQIYMPHDPTPSSAEPLSFDRQRQLVQCRTPHPLRATSTTLCERITTSSESTR
jgi:hypothetical protein